MTMEEIVRMVIALDYGGANGGGGGRVKYTTVLIACDAVLAHRLVTAQLQTVGFAHSAGRVNKSCIPLYAGALAEPVGFAHKFAIQDSGHVECEVWANRFVSAVGSMATSEGTRFASDYASLVCP